MGKSKHQSHPSSKFIEDGDFTRNKSSKNKRPLNKNKQSKNQKYWDTIDDEDDDNIIDLY